MNKRKLPKWKKALRAAERKHLDEVNVTSLEGFRRNRVSQRQLAEKHDVDLWNICGECNHIENVLKEKGFNV